MNKYFNKIILILSLPIISINTHASSSVYMDTITGKHFIVRNQASGAEAQPKALKYCIAYTGTAKKCKLIYKTNYGGYGAIAIGDKSQGYAHGLSRQDLAEKYSIEKCQEDSLPSTCHVVTRWKDEGKIIAIYNDDNYTQQENNTPEPYRDCGISSAGLPLDCKTGLDYYGKPAGIK